MQNGSIAYYAKNVYTSLDTPSKLFTTENGFILYADSEAKEYYLVGYAGSETEITLPDNIDGNNYTINQYAFCDCTSLTSIIIPGCVTSIGREAFSGCNSLTSITIPDSVTSIGWSAFNGCTSLADIEIPDSVAYIDMYAFRGCTSLTSIIIGNGVTSIGDSAFSGCSSLTSITIPDGVASIGSSVFGGCDSLDVVFYGGTESDWENINIDYHNSSLTNAIRYYYSETQPTEEGNFWHYDTDGATPVIWTIETV